MKIAFVHLEHTSFVLKDLRILKQTHEVRDCFFHGMRPMFGLLKHGHFPVVGKEFAELLGDILWCDIALAWSGKLHAFFTVLVTKMLGKKTIVVASGEDVAKCTVAGKPYGIFAHPIKKWFAYFIYRHADCILCVSESNLLETINNAGANPQKTRLIYHGFEAEVFKQAPGAQKQRLVVTVGRINHENIYRKGLKLFVETAKRLPTISFILVGPSADGSIDLLKRLAPRNVTFADGLYGDDLVAVLSKATVYVQVSEWESFGCSLAEAMLCECIPVVSRQWATPEVAGECGFYVDELTPEAVATQIKKALASNLGKRARERIIRKFPLEKRRGALLDAVEKVMGR